MRAPPTKPECWPTLLQTVRWATSDLAIYDPTVAALTVEEILSLLTRTEQAAFAVDPRIADTHIERFGQVVEQIAIVNSRGIALNTHATGCYISLSIIARQNQFAERGYAGMVARGPGGLDPEDIGARAARRAVTPIGGSPLTTRRGAVVFEPDVIAELIAESRRRSPETRWSRAGRCSHQERVRRSGSGRWSARQSSTSRTTAASRVRLAPCRSTVRAFPASARR